MKQKRNYANRRIMVIGAGKTGIAVAAWLLNQGARVTISDNRGPDEIADFRALLNMGVLLDVGQHNDGLLASTEMIIKSPGVKPDMPLLLAAIERNIPVLGELDIFADESSARTVAITGTNGKSTTTTLAGDIFQAWGKRTFIGGNIGTPLVSSLGGEKFDWAVVELSSFQLDGVERFRPKYGMFLNYSIDHLDWHPNADAYLAAKMNMFRMMTGHDRAILNADDPVVIEATKSIRAKKIYFSSQKRLNEGFFVEGDELVWRYQGDELRFPYRELKIIGRHNFENVMAAMIPALMEGCPAELAWQQVTQFCGLPHRMELVAEIDSVRYYNDSKGTNIGSVQKSLEGFDGDIVLIAGGKDKGGDYRVLREQIKEKVSTLILIGEATELMAEAFAGCAEIIRAKDMKSAVHYAQEVSHLGGAVLFSPGCSSFDMFTNFVKRGEAFAHEVEALPRKVEA